MRLEINQLEDVLKDYRYVYNRRPRRAVNEK